MKTVTIFFTIVLAMLVSCQPQTKEAITDEEFNFIPFTEISQIIANEDFEKISSLKSNVKNLEAFIPETVRNDNLPLGTSLVCSNPPSLEEVKQAKLVFTDRLYTVSQAYKLGIPVANMSVSANSRVYVRDYSRYKQCLANDQTTTLNYGQVIRTVIEIKDFDASLGLDLAAIAASGTLKKKEQNFYLYKDGIFNSKIDPIIAEVSGKVFDVENYALYQSVMSRMIALLNEPETSLSVQPIGVVQSVGDDLFMIEAPIITYTLARIAKGEDCEAIKARLKNNPEAVSIVSQVFDQLQFPCDPTDPSEEVKLKAEKYLQGVRVKVNTK